MFNYATKQKEITEKFEAIQKEVIQLQQVIQEKQAELLRLQGEFRLLENLKKVEEEEVKKIKK